MFESRHRVLSTGRSNDHLSECFALCESIIQRYNRAGRSMTIGERLAMESLLRVLPLTGSSLEKNGIGERHRDSFSFDIEAALKEPEERSGGNNNEQANGGIHGSNAGNLESGLGSVLRFLEDFDNVTKNTEQILRGVGEELCKALRTPIVRLFRVSQNDDMLIDDVAGIACKMDDSTAVGKSAKEEVIFSIGSTLYVPLRVKGEFVGCIEALNAVSTAPTSSVEFQYFMRVVGLVMRNCVKSIDLENDKKTAATMIQMATRLSMDSLDESLLVDSIISSAKALTESDRCSVFLVAEDRSVSAHFEGGHNVLLPRGTGIAGHVAETGEVVNIANAYEDERFATVVDKLTGYHTKTLLCLPVKAEGEIVAVAQLVNKINFTTASGTQLPRTFSERDGELFSKFSSFAGAALRNCRIYEHLQQEKKKSEVMYDVLSSLHQSDIRDMNGIVQQILTGATKLLNAERTELFLLDKEKNELYCQFPDKATGKNIRFKNGEGIPGVVAQTGRGESIEDAYSDPRFNRLVDKQMGYRTQSLLCEPITLNGEVIAVVQLVNKINHKNEYVSFTTKDEEVFRVFSIFAGVLINNASLLSFAVKAGNEALVLHNINDSAILSPKLRHHLSKSDCSEDQGILNTKEVISKILTIEVPLKEAASHCFDLFRLRKTSNFPLDDAAAVVYRLFVLTGLPKKFNCEESTLLNYILQCRERYRFLSYHNFYHAVDVFQTLFTFLFDGGASAHLTELDCFTLLVCSLSLDLDHVGLNNSFFLKTASPLEIVSCASGNGSVLEVHHCNVAIEILSEPQNDVFEGVSISEKAQCYQNIISCILATDMSKHDVEVATFCAVLNEGYDVCKQEHRQCVLNILMKAADISNVTKPFEISQQWAMAIRKEFYHQGEMEKEKDLTAHSMCDRSSIKDVAKGQIEYIDLVATKFFNVIVHSLFSKMIWCLDNIESNRSRWTTVLQEN